MDNPALTKLVKLLAERDPYEDWWEHQYQLYYERPIPEIQDEQPNEIRFSKDPASTD